MLTFLGGGGDGVPNLNARVYRNNAKVIAHGVNTAIDFEASRFNNGGMWVLASPTRLTVPTAGVYLIGAHVNLATQAATGETCALHIKLNGTTYLGVQNAPAGNDEISRSLATLALLAANDYVEMFLYCDTNGPNQSLQAVAQYTPEFWIQKMR